MHRMWMAAMAAALQLASPAVAHEAGNGAMLAGPTILSRGRTVVPVRLGPNVAAGAAHAMLVIDGLAYDAPPGVLYEVSLQAPNGRRAPLGVISFYNRTAPGYGAAPAGPEDRRRFDATDALRRLGGRASALVFEPSAGVTGPGIAAAANPAARVRFASVRLE
ncbi:MAG: tyrosinase family protein [Alphaproteobacteria bacterium]|nr:tyrosinase family protein [Alphaproteobacteria bacterium]